MVCVWWVIFTLLRTRNKLLSVASRALPDLARAASPDSCYTGCQTLISTVKFATGPLHVLFPVYLRLPPSP